jgi:hypothetical protein
MADPSIEILAKVADALGELRERMTFAGGCATGLLIADPGASPVRATQDVDAVVAVVSLAEYHQLGAALPAGRVNAGCNPRVASPWTRAMRRIPVLR